MENKEQLEILQAGAKKELAENLSTTGIAYVEILEEKLKHTQEMLENARNTNILNEQTTITENEKNDKIDYKVLSSNRLVK